MKVEQIFENEQPLTESFALSKIRKVAQQRMGNDKSVVVLVLQNPEDKSDYVVLMNDKRTYSRFRLRNGRVGQVKEITKEQSKRVAGKLLVDGYKSLEPKSFIQKYKMQMFGGLMTAGIFAATGGLGTAVLGPLIANALLIAWGEIEGNLRAPLGLLAQTGATGTGAAIAGAGLAGVGAGSGSTSDGIAAAGSAAGG